MLLLVIRGKRANSENWDRPLEPRSSALLRSPQQASVQTVR